MLDIFYFIHHRGDHVHYSLFYRCAFIFYLLRVILCTDDGLRIALLLWIDLILYNTIQYNTIVSRTGQGREGQC